MDEVSLTVAALRVTPTPWDLEGNVARLESFARRAAEQGAELVVTPEGFLEGYPWNDENPGAFSRQRYLDVAVTVDGPLIDRVRALAAALVVHLVVGFAERVADRVYNSAITISPAGVIVSRYAKTHTAGDDEPFNTKGTEFPVVETTLGRWGTLICMDRQLPEPARILAVKGARLILVPSWGMYGEINDVMMRTRAFENGVYLAFVHPKRCLIIDPDGTIVAQDSGRGDEIVTARITLPGDGRRGPIRQRRPEIYGEILDGG
jgi:5-aminopentanamidase